jgi:hypothetical protein
MSADFQLVAEVLDGPVERQGPRYYQGSKVVISAHPRPKLPHIDPQCLEVVQRESGLLLVPGVGSHVRVGEGTNWAEIQRLDGPLEVDDGQIVYLGPIQRGLTIRLVGFRALFSQTVEPKLVRSRREIGALVLGLIVLLTWMLASSSY